MLINIPSYFFRVRTWGFGGWLLLLIKIWKVLKESNFQLQNLAPEEIVILHLGYKYVLSGLTYYIWKVGINRVIEKLQTQVSMVQEA